MRNLRRRRYWWRAHTCGRLGRGLSCQAVEQLDKFGLYVAFGYLLPGVELGSSPRGSPWPTSRAQSTGRAGPDSVSWSSEARNRLTRLGPSSSTT